MYEKIKRWYYLGLWSRQMVQTAAEKSIITESEALNIIKETIT